MENPITMTSCQSASIAEHGYDAATQTLALRFKSGKGQVYHYTDVPASLYEKLCAAPSIGSFFHKHIAGAYSHTKIDVEPKKEGADADAG